MKNSLAFIIDKLTESIEQTKTGKKFKTDVFPVSRAEIKTILKKEGWLFNWKEEYNISNHQVYKLVLKAQTKSRA
jgi:hypothetical protein